MMFRIFWILMCLSFVLTGCSTSTIPDSQLSAQELRDGVRAPGEGRWIEPLNEPQKSALASARRAWSDGDLGEARAILDDLLEVRPKHPDLLANAAIVARAEGEPEEARELFNEALKVDPGHRVASNNLSLLLREEGEFIEARRALIRALEYHPDDPTLHYNLAVVYELYLQDLQKALDHYQRYLSLITEPDPEVEGWVVDLERRTQQ